MKMQVQGRLRMRFRALKHLPFYLKRFLTKSYIYPIPGCLCRRMSSHSSVSLKKKASVSGVQTLKESGITNPSRYRTRNIPAAGALIKEEDSPDKQISFEV